MIKIISALLFLSTASHAVVDSFIPCVAEEGQQTIKRVREVLNAPTKAGNADFVGYYELLKARQVIGYLPYFMERNKPVIAEAFFCSTSYQNYFYVRGAAQNIENWQPKNKELIVLKGIQNDEAVSNLKLTRINNSEIKVDVFIRLMGGGNNIIKDVAILSLKPKKSL